MKCLLTYVLTWSLTIVNRYLVQLYFHKIRRSLQWLKLRKLRDRSDMLTDCEECPLTTLETLLTDVTCVWRRWPTGLVGRPRLPKRAWLGACYCHYCFGWAVPNFLKRHTTFCCSSKPANYLGKIYQGRKFTIKC